MPTKYNDYSTIENRQEFNSNSIKSTKYLKINKTILVKLVGM